MAKVREHVQEVGPRIAGHDARWHEVPVRPAATVHIRCAGTSHWQMLRWVAYHEVVAADRNSFSEAVHAVGVGRFELALKHPARSAPLEHICASNLLLAARCDAWRTHNDVVTVNRDGRAKLIARDWIWRRERGLEIPGIAVQSKNVRCAFSH